MVGLVDLSVLESVHQRTKSLLVLGHQKNAGSVLVQPVDDPRPTGLGRGQIAAVMQKPMHQGAADMAGGRVYYQSGGFVDHQEVLVFVENRKIDVFRNQIRGRRRWKTHRDHIVGMQTVAGLYHLAVHQSVGRIDQPVQRGAGMFGEFVEEKMVQSLPDLVWPHLQATAFSGQGRIP